MINPDVEPIQVDPVHIESTPQTEMRVVLTVLGVLAGVVLGSVVTFGMTIALAPTSLAEVALAALIHGFDIALGGVIGFLVSARTRP